MDYVKQHEQNCKKLRERALSYMKKTGVAASTLCRAAGVQIHTLKVLEKGTAEPSTMQRLKDHLDVVHPEDDAEQVQSSLDGAA